MGNPRLWCSFCWYKQQVVRNQIIQVIKHSGVKIILTDAINVPILEGIKDEINIERYIVLDEEKNIPDTSLKPIESYESLLAKAQEEYDFPDADEDSYATMYYSTGTTGDPEGVRFTHRMIWLQSLKCLSPESGDINADDVTLLFAPFFAVNAWGIPYASTMAGVKQVFAGPGFDPERAINLIKNEKVTCSYGVPTMDKAIIEVAKMAGRVDDLKDLRYMHCGGGVLDPVLVKDIRALGIEVAHMYGITECCPNIVTCFLRAEIKDVAYASDEEYVKFKVHPVKAYLVS
ncbi:MAG: AMP-binding protein [Thermodesulfobacteriota bacterium]|nr:AMP-binding protein [Thermodesulfobacteriota bacterium]